MPDNQSEQLSVLPNLPQDAEGPVFNEPWEAQAFAMTLKLHEQGCFSWTEWAGCLSDEIAAAKAAGHADLGDTYYHHWLKALEQIVSVKGLASREELADRKQAWEDAAAHAQHGKPITLD